MCNWTEEHFKEILSMNRNPLKQLYLPDCKEILFRGKRLLDGQWIEGDVSHHKSGKVFIKLKYGSATSSYEIDKKTLSQYKGFSDKFGEKIWDNSICEFYTVDDGYGVGIIKNDHVYWIGGQTSQKYLLTPLSSINYSQPWTVVGNIFDDNPLLKCLNVEIKMKGQSL